MKAIDVQIGGNHYKTMAIQPMEFSLKLDLNAAKHTAIKYASRFESKGGIEDLQKAAHSLELLRDYWIESENTDCRDFECLVAAMSYCRENKLSSLQTDFIVLTVMAYDHDELAYAIESCRDLIAAVECNNYHDTIMPNPVTGNWPASADERMEPIMQNGNDGDHYGDLDMSDPANWREGDALMFMDVDCELYTQYETYTVMGFKFGYIMISCDTSEITGLSESRWETHEVDCFKWRSRPSIGEIIKDNIVTKAPGDVFIQTEDGETARYSAAGYAASKEQ